MEKKFKCYYSCKHFFGCSEIMAKNEEDAKIGLKINIESKHQDESTKIKNDCGDKCKLVIKIQ